MKPLKETSEFNVKSLIIKSIILGLLGFVGLFIFNITRVFTVLASSWMLIMHISFIVIIEWCVFVSLLYTKGLPSGKNIFIKILKWICYFLPLIIGIALIFIIYKTGKGDESLLTVNMENFRFSLLFYILSALIFWGAVNGIMYIFSSPEKKAKRKERAQKEEPKKEESEEKKEEKKDDKELGREVFPDLLAIDAKYAQKPYVPILSDDVTLKQLCISFNMYLESKGMFYTPETIRAFIAGMASSRFIILEGMSGTGKTSLPKYFAEFINCDACFTSVQASWKDRSDILGFYNSLTCEFKETPFLRSLYEANYRRDEVNFMVLDEMNLSRVEYYFADFLSVLEFDKSKWSIELMPLSTKGKTPNKLVDGWSIFIPDNTWFIGTANKDDSTYTITDKVYDRASIIDFNKRNESNTEAHNISKINISSDKLMSLFDDAIKNMGLNDEVMKKFSLVTEYMLNTFDINFGNRILNQISRFVPVYVACGGTSESALDLIFARKILRKLDGKFEDGVKSNLVKLEKMLDELFGVESFRNTKEYIAKIKRKLI